MKRVMTVAFVAALALFGMTGCSSNCSTYCDRASDSAPKDGKAGGILY